MSLRCRSAVSLRCHSDPSPMFRSAAPTGFRYTRKTDKATPYGLRVGHGGEAEQIPRPPIHFLYEGMAQTLNRLAILLGHVSIPQRQVVFGFEFFPFGDFHEGLGLFGRKKVRELRQPGRARIQDTARARPCTFRSIHHPVENLLPIYAINRRLRSSAFVPRTSANIVAWGQTTHLQGLWGGGPMMRALAVLRCLEIATQAAGERARLGRRILTKGGTSRGTQPIRKKCVCNFCSIDDHFRASFPSTAFIFILAVWMDLVLGGGPVQHMQSRRPLQKRCCAAARSGAVFCEDHSRRQGMRSFRVRRNDVAAGAAFDSPLTAG